MPPRVNSRYSFSTARLEATTDKLMLSPRIPFRYLERGDNRTHTVKRGDKLWTLAARYFAPLGRLPLYSASMLYWVIQDYQPEPIHDPTLELAEGTTVVIPSIAVVIDRVLATPDTRVV